MLQATREDLLPTKLISNDKVAPTFFWVDNFDVTIDRLSGGGGGGGGSVNTTHLMAFQEKTDDTRTLQQNVIVSRRRSHHLFYEDIAIPSKPVDAKKEPPQHSINTEFEYASEDFQYIVLFMGFPTQ